MASNSKPFGLTIQSMNCDDVPKSRRKPSVVKRITRAAKPTNLYQDDEDSDDQQIYPEIFVKVEVREADETFSPNNSGEEKPPPTPPPTKRKKPAKLKKKKKRKKVAASDNDEQPEADQAEEFVCDICNRKFKKLFNLQRHVVVHRGDFKCKLCGEAFNSQFYLNKHSNTKHAKGKKCDVSKSAEELSSTRSEYIESSNSSWCDTSGAENCKEKIPKSELSYTVQHAIVNKMHKGVTVKEICRFYNVTVDTVNDIWNERDKYGILPQKMARRGLKYMNSILEPPILEWYNGEKAKNSRITGKMFQDLAAKVAKENGFVHFTAGDKWLEQFKKKHNIYFNTRKRNYAATSESIWKTKFFQEQWSVLRPNYTDDEIYMADEVGLFFNPSPSRERKFNGKLFIQGEAADRFTIFLCSNVSGSDKRKMLVSGSEDPLRRSYRHQCSLPVDFQRNTESHITTNMFEGYVKKWNEDLRRINKKVVLIVDRASIHSKLELTNLKLEFLPWKGANSIMPMKNGVFSRFRSEFRNLLLQFKTMNVMKGIDRHLTYLEALEMLEKAWNRTPPNVITKSFVELGFEVQNYDSSISESSDKCDEKLCEFLKDYDVEHYFTDLSAMDMYLTVDDKLLVAKGTNPTLFGGNHKVTEPKRVETKPDELPLNTERPISNEKELLVRKSGAIADLEIVRSYLQSNRTSYEMYCNFMNVEKDVMENFVKLT